MIPLFRRVGICLFLMIGLLVSAALAVEGDVVFKRERGVGEDTPPAVFPHWFHRIQFRCYVCHPAIFEMKAGASKITMDAIDEGKFCGTCHNSKIAFESGFDTCSRCHVEREGITEPPKKEERAEKKEPVKKEEKVEKKDPVKKEETPEKKETTKKEEPAKKAPAKNKEAADKKEPATKEEVVEKKEPPKKEEVPKQEERVEKEKPLTIEEQEETEEPVEKK